VAITLLELSQRLDPTSPHSHSDLGLAYYLHARYREAIASLENARSLGPTHQSTLLLLPAVYAKAGRIDDAKRAAGRLLQHYPFFRRRDYTLFRDPAHNAAVVEGLRLAGVQ
jgi:tetratricopeptide (TPR) repeat protein